MSTWDPADPKVLELPSGRLVRGRSLHQETSAVDSELATIPEFELVLLGSRRAIDARTARCAATETRWVKWPDFWLPSDSRDAAAAMNQLWERAASKRTGVACNGGRGRTGTALACIAIIDGVPPREAVDFVRAGFDTRAVETPWQKRYVELFESARRA